MQFQHDRAYTTVMKGIGVVFMLLTLGLGGCLSTRSVRGVPDASNSKPFDREYREGDTPTPTFFDFRFQFPSSTDTESG